MQCNADAPNDAFHCQASLPRWLSTWCRMPFATMKCSLASLFSPPSGVKRRVGGSTPGLQPPTTRAGSGSHLSCKRAALSAYQCDLARRRRQRPRARCGGVGQPGTLPPGPAAGSIDGKEERKGRDRGSPAVLLFELMTSGQDGCLASFHELDRWTGGRRTRSPAPEDQNRVVFIRHRQARFTTSFSPSELDQQD